VRKASFWSDLRNYLIMYGVRETGNYNTAKQRVA